MRQVIYNYPGPKRRPNPSRPDEKPWKGGEYFRAVKGMVPAFVVAEREGAVDLLVISPTGSTERRNGITPGDGPDEYLDGVTYEAAMAARQLAEVRRLEQEAADAAAKLAAAKAKLSKP